MIGENLIEKLTLSKDLIEVYIVSSQGCKGQVGELEVMCGRGLPGQVI